VTGTPSELDEVRTFIRAIDPGRQQKMISVQGLDVVDVADTLKSALGDTKTGPFIEAQKISGAVLVVGSKGQIEQAEELVKVLAANEDSSGSSIRIITINQGSASTAAEAVERMFKQMRKNPVNVISPSRRPEDSLPKRDRDRDEEKPLKKTGLDRYRDVEMVAYTDEKPEKKTDFKELKDRDTEKKDPKDLPGSTDMPVTISAFGNRIVVSSKDPKALALVSELIRLVMTSPGEGDFEVIKLRYATAADAARIIDEAFNGPKQQPGQQQPGPGGIAGIAASLIGIPGIGGGGARPGAPGALAATERVRVVADPGTNSILVRANPIDFLTIKKLLDLYIDINEADSLALMKTWYVGPLKFATAVDVAHVLENVYHQQMGHGPQQTQAGGMQGMMFPGFGRQGAPAQGGAAGQRITLSVGVDEQNNSLVLACSEVMKDDIQKLIDMMETQAKDHTRVIKIIQTRGLDPYLVQQAVNAIQGKSTPPRQTQLGGPGQQGFGQQGFGQQGFGQQGFGQQQSPYSVPGGQFIR